MNDKNTTGYPQDRDQLRAIASIAAMHGELASQGDGVDWSGSVDQLAGLSVRYADALLLALDGQPSALPPESESA